MEEIRALNGKTKESDCGFKRDAMLEGMNAMISEASLGEQIGLRKAEMSRQRGIKRAVAKLIEKIYLRIAELTNRDIRAFNSVLLRFMRSVCGKLESLFYNDQLLDNRLSSYDESIRNLQLKADNLENEVSTLRKTCIEYEEQLLLLQRYFPSLDDALRNLQLKADNLENEVSMLRKICIEYEEQLLLLQRYFPSLDEALYHDFEERFRGSQNDIRHRLEAYIPIILNKGNTFSGKVILDLGCGRGEMLDVLKANGADNMLGIDINPVQLQICRDKGHRVLEQDCLEYLHGLESASVDYIFAIQLVEHLPFEALLSFFSECGRVLKTGGMLLCETPNCNNILTAASTFYIDPSHQRPIHPDFARFIAERSGFTEVEIIGMNSDEYAVPFQAPSGPSEDRNECAQNISTLNRIFFGPRDYALIGIRE